MADTSTDHSTSSAGIDLSQFYQVFFEEAGENLENMEQLLLELDIEAADDEELNAIFRCAHSIKGGAATFSAQARVPVAAAPKPAPAQPAAVAAPAVSAATDAAPTERQRTVELRVGPLDNPSQADNLVDLI